MAGNQSGNPAQHFGRQMRKERLSRGWSLPELSQRTGINAGHLSRIETGRRPPSERLARACDAAFPERKGWFAEYYQESRAWAEVPAWFRSWQEYEDTAATLRVWSPGIVHGLLQTEAYARALICVQPAITSDITASRLAARTERQHRVILRDDPPAAWLVVDELSLYRRVGSAEIMAGQLGRLAQIAAMPHVTMQVLPAVEHPANASEFILADEAAWCEHVAGGYVFTDGKTVSSLAARFDSLRAECYRASESAALINRTGDLWAAGASPLTVTATAAPASR